MAGCPGGGRLPRRVAGCPGGWQAAQAGGRLVAQVGGRLPRSWTVSIPAAVPFGRHQRHIRFASFRPEQRPSRLRVLARPYPPTISIEIAEVVHRHRRVGMRHADSPQVPLKSKVRFQWNLRLLSAETDSMNVFAPAVTAQHRRSPPGPAAPAGPAAAAAHTGSPAHRLQSPPETVHTTPQGLDCEGGPVKHNPNQEANNTRARLLDRPSRLGQPDDLPPETAPSSRVPPGQNPPQPSDQPCTRPACSLLASTCVLRACRRRCRFAGPASRIPGSCVDGSTRAARPSPPHPGPRVATNDNVRGPNTCWRRPFRRNAVFNAIDRAPSERAEELSPPFLAAPRLRTLVLADAVAFANA